MLVPPQICGGKSTHVFAASWILVGDFDPILIWRENWRKILHRRILTPHKVLGKLHSYYEAKQSKKKFLQSLKTPFFYCSFKKTRFPGRTAPNHLDCMHLILFYFVYVNFLYCKLAEGISCINNCNNKRLIS